MYGLGVGVNLLSGFADPGERSEVEGETADVGCGNILLDGVLGQL
jgi:hypothetical protein